jgi:hypothetical protein
VGGAVLRSGSKTMTSFFLVTANQHRDEGPSYRRPLVLRRGAAPSKTRCRDYETRAGGGGGGAQLSTLNSLAPHTGTRSPLGGIKGTIIVESNVETRSAHGFKGFTGGSP